MLGRLERHLPRDHADVFALQTIHFGQMIVFIQDQLDRVEKISRNGSIGGRSAGAVESFPRILSIGR